MKKKGTIGIVATLGLGLCAYALSQQPQVKEEKKNQIQYLQADKKSSATSSSKKEDSIEAVNAKEKTQHCPKHKRLMLLMKWARK